MSRKRKFSEFSWINEIKKIIPGSLQGKFGIGDDCGIFESSNKGPWLVTTDSLVEGVDFEYSKAKPEWVGRKALAINLSDLAAMGAKPKACVISLGIPSHISFAWIKRFYKGLIPLAQKYKTHCIGGDISSSKQFFVSIALIGCKKKDGFLPRRSLARAGDLIGITGTLGGSILKKHFLFEPRLQEGEFLAGYRVNAMMDISDGLVQDLGHILRASKVGAKIDLNQIPVSKDAMKLSRGNRSQALKHGLTDGEDFELLFTLPNIKAERLCRSWKKRFPRTKLSWIGRILPEKNKIYWFRKQKEVARPIGKKEGFVHF